MKKLLFSLLLVSGTLVAFAENKEVLMESIKSTQPITRSLVQKPTVTIDDVTFQLSIKFAAPTESFTVFVYDGKGVIVYQDNVITDGGVHDYKLPELESGFCTIVIEGEKRSFEGEFDI